MNPRQLNCFVNILRERTRTTESGSVQSLGYVKHHRKMPAEFMPATGGETLRADKVDAAVDGVFTVRYVRDLLHTDQVEHDGKRYEIKSIIDAKNTHEWLNVLVSQVPEPPVAPEDAAAGEEGVDG